ncbi:MAGE family-domain-containing protein [Cladochytrium replicatum]|nr:MAGE family-domain-containing protein [Cladochytrium replicatum]
METVQEQNEDEEEAEFEATQAHQVPGTVSEKALGSVTEEDTQRAVKMLVRYALFCEHRRQPIRRDDFMKKIVKELPTRAFPAILKRANNILRSTFGFEMAELPVRPPRANSKRPSSVPTDGGREKNSNSFILRNVIPEEERVDDASLGHDAPRLVLITVILSLIYVSGKTIQEEVLLNYFSKMGINRTTGIPKSQVQDHTIVDALQGYVKDGYLDRIKVSTSERDVHEYRWGPRAKIEFPQENVSGFIVDVHGNEDENMNKRMKRDIEHLAGEDPEL